MPISAIKVPLSDDDLRRSLVDTENNFIERKTFKNHKGWLRTVVAFANSVPEGFVGLLYIGVTDDGKVENTAGVKFEELQKTVSEVLSAAYPPIYTLYRTLDKDGLEYLVVIVPGSPDRPHFAGKSFVRIGPETRDASEKQFDQLIAERASVGRFLSGLVGTEVIVRSSSGVPDTGTVVDCSQYFVTVRFGSESRCYPLKHVTINFEPRYSLYKLEIG